VIKDSETSCRVVIEMGDFVIGTEILIPQDNSTVSV
jgi:hypothetical protein